MDYRIKTIETKRLILRPVAIDDAKDMFEYASVKENLGYIQFTSHQDLDDTKRIIQDVFLSKPSKNMPETWAIILKENQKMIGTIDFNQLNKRTQEAYVGYILNQKYWNQGLMTEALKAVIKFGFKQFNLKTIFAKCHPLNFASSKVMSKSGMDFFEPELDRQGQIAYLVYHIENQKWRN